MYIKFLLVSMFIVSSALAKGGGDDAGNGGDLYLNRIAVNQYVCLERFIGTRYYFYYTEEDMPLPKLPKENIVCHDVKKYGGEDSIFFPRLELEENYFNIFSRIDTRFRLDENGKFLIEKVIMDRFNRENGTKMEEMEIFSSRHVNQGIVVLPFESTNTHNFRCIKNNDQDLSLIERMILEYTGDLDAIYIGQSLDGDISQYVTGNQLLRNAFYVKNGTKFAVQDTSTIDKKTIYYYYPFDSSLSIFNQEDRTLFKVRAIRDNPYNNSKIYGCIPY